MIYTSIANFSLIGLVVMASRINKLTTNSQALMTLVCDKVDKITYI